MKKVIAFLVFAIVLCGCASKRFVKKGLEMENAGLYSDAANQYYNSLLKNINNVDAKLGLQRTGQLVLDDYIEEFKSKYKSGTTKEAVYAFVKADNYFNKLKKVGVNPVFPEDQRVYYKEVEDSYIGDLYEKATKALGAEEFETAESLYGELLKFNNVYKDAKSKWKIAKYEPLYRKGNDYLGTEMYRSAYLTFKGINDEVQSYENSIALMNDALQEAKITISVDLVNIYNPKYRSEASFLRDRIINGVSNIKSPLYEVVDINKPSPSGFYSMGKRVNEGKRIVPAKASISSGIQKVYMLEGKLVKEEKRGYLKRVVEYMDKVTNEKKKRNEYDKVRYYEFKKENKAMLTIDYSMKRNDSGEIIFRDLFNKQASDRIHYCTFSGDYKKLVPGYWKYQEKDSAEDYINDDSGMVNSLHSLFRDDNGIQSAQQLKETLINEAVDNLVEKVLEYQPEK